MKVLITNDDGINSFGLLALYNFTKYVLGFTDIWIVAPDADKSASSHSVSLHKGLDVTKLSERKFSVRGTPSDCVLLAVSEIMKNDLPDLVFSGINSGANVGMDTLYSGTVGAAMEGTFLGIYSFAFSKLYYSNKKNIMWETDDAMLKMLLLDLLNERESLIQSTININLPVGSTVKGIKFVKQGDYKTDNVVSSRGPDFVIDTDSKSFYCPMLKDNFITVTTLGYDLTHYKNLAYLDGKYSY